MRSAPFMIALSLAVLAAPVVAQDVSYVPGTGDIEREGPIDGADYTSQAEDAPVGDLSAKISDPMMQETVAAVVEDMAGALMAMPVGPMVDAIENARPGMIKRSLRRNATLADVAGRDARYLPEELGERSREAMGMMGGVANAVAVMMPEIERMGRQMEESFRAAKARARPYRD